MINDIKWKKIKKFAQTNKFGLNNFFSQLIGHKEHKKVGKGEYTAKISLGYEANPISGEKKQRRKLLSFKAPNDLEVRNPDPASIFCGLCFQKSQILCFPESNYL